MDELERQIGQLEGTSHRMLDTAEKMVLAQSLGLQRESTASKRFKITIWAAGVTMALVLAMFVGILIALTIAADSRAQIKDCIDPSGKCYQQGQRQTAGVLGKLLDGQAAAAVCEDEYIDEPLQQRYADVKACEATLVGSGG